MTQNYSTIGGMEPAEFAQDAGAVLAGYIAPALGRAAVEGVLPWDLPDEVYGAVLIGGIEYGTDGGKTARYVQLGGGVYIAEKVLERLGVKEKAMQAAQEAGN